MTADRIRRDLIRAMALAGAFLPIAGRTIMTAPLLTRRIPSSGETLPVIGVGTWQAFDISNDDKARADAVATLRAFVAQGLRVVDTSPMYGRAEEMVGQLLEEIDNARTAFIATKVWTSGAEAGRRQIERSFQLLRRPKLDLIQVHNLLDADAHLATLAELKSAGRIRYIGVTHYTASAHADLVKYIERGNIDFVQVNYSLMEREAENRVLPAAAAHNVAVLINRPLAEGALLARVRGKDLPAWADEIGVTTWAQFALKWIVGHPAVTCVIPGTRNPVHLADNIAAGTGLLPDASMRKRMADYFATA